MRKDSVSSLCKLNSLVWGIFVVNLSQNLLQSLCQGSLFAYNFSFFFPLGNGTTISAGSIPAN